MRRKTALLAAFLVWGCTSESTNTTVVNTGGSGGGGSGGAQAGAGGATGGAAGTSVGGTAGSSAGGTAGTSTGGTANSGGGGTAAVAGTGGSAGAASCGTPADVCADACLAKINALADTAVKECLADPTCTCDLGCYVSSYCKSAGGCSPNTKRDVAIDAICSAAIAECSYIFCNP